MNLDELIQEVYTITNRPDLAGETLSGIKAATLKAHHCDYFWKDIFESGVMFDTAEYVQNFDYRTVIPNWRAAKYLRVYDNVNQCPGHFLKLLTPDMILDAYGNEKTNVYYGGGAELTIKTSAPQQYFLLGCYVHPNVTVTGYNSWVALDHPFAIIYEAAAIIFKSIGKDSEAAAQRTMVAEQLTMLKASNILAEGY